MTSSNRFNVWSGVSFLVKVFLHTEHLKTILVSSARISPARISPACIFIKCSVCVQISGPSGVCLDVKTWGYNVIYSGFSAVAPLFTNVLCFLEG